MDSRKRPTLADVAELSGFSKTAVSLILNDRPGSRLSVDAARRVRAAAEQLGYKPNPAALSLRLGKTRTIGFLSDEVTITGYALGLIKGVLNAAKALEHTVLMAQTERDFFGVSQVVSELLDRRVDGLIVGLIGARMVDLPLDGASIPVVLVNGRTTTGITSILPDEYAAGRTVAQELLTAGHHRIGVIGELPGLVGDPRKSVTIAQRFEGMDDAFRAAGVEPVRAQLDGWSADIGYTNAGSMLTAHPELTGLIAGNDNVAFGIYQALGEMGLRVPEDVSVVSFDDDELAGYLRPGLTTARLPYEEMARLGVEMILGERPLEDTKVVVPLTRRESVRTIDSWVSGRAPGVPDSNVG